MIRTLRSVCLASTAFVCSAGFLCSPQPAQQPQAQGSMSEAEGQAIRDKNFQDTLASQRARFEQEKTSIENQAANWPDGTAGLSDKSKSSASYAAGQSEYDETMAEMEKLVAEEEAHYQWGASITTATDPDHTKLVNTYGPLQENMRNLGYRLARCQQTLNQLQANDR